MAWMFTEQRIEKFLEGAAAAQDARFDRADAALEDFRNFFVAQPFQVAQDDGAAKDVGHLSERLLHDGLNFARSQLVEGRCVQVFDLDAGLALFGFGVNRNIFLQVTPEPAAVIEGFANSDAVEPSLQLTALTKQANALEGLEKNFLRAVGGVSGIAQHAQDQVENRSVVVSNQPVECGFRAGLQLGDQFRFVTAPREGASPIGHAVPFCGREPLGLHLFRRFACWPRPCFCDLLDRGLVRSTT